MNLVRHEILLRPANRRLLQRARSHARRKEWLFAKELYSELLKNVADSPALWLQYGHVSKEQGSYEEAEAAYRTAARLVPHAVEPHRHLGFLLRSSNKHEESRDAFLRGYAADPRANDLDIELRRGGLSPEEIAKLAVLTTHELGAVTKAERRLLGPAIIGVVAQSLIQPLVQQAAQRRHWRAAVKGYQLLHKMAPTNPRIAVQLGHAHKELGELVEAKLAYREALIWNPWYGDAYLHLGHLAKGSGDPETARYCYLYAWRLAPNTNGIEQELQGLGMDHDSLWKSVQQSCLSDDGPELHVPGVAKAWGQQKREKRPPAGMSSSAKSYWFALQSNSEERI